MKSEKEKFNEVKKKLEEFAKKFDYEITEASGSVFINPPTWSGCPNIKLEMEDTDCMTPSADNVEKYNKFRKAYSARETDTYVDIILPPEDYINEDGSLLTYSQFIERMEHDKEFFLKWNSPIER